MTMRHCDESFLLCRYREVSNIPLGAPISINILNLQNLLVPTSQLSEPVAYVCNNVVRNTVIGYQREEEKHHKQTYFTMSSLNLRKNFASASLDATTWPDKTWTGLEERRGRKGGVREDREDEEKHLTHDSVLSSNQREPQRGGTQMRRRHRRSRELGVRNAAIQSNLQFFPSPPIQPLKPASLSFIGTSQQL